MVLWTALTSKTKDKEYQSLFETGHDLHILIMNVEALSTKKGLNLINAASIKGDELLKDFAITETEAATLSSILDKIRD